MSVKQEQNVQRGYVGLSKANMLQVRPWCANQDFLNEFAA